MGCVNEINGASIQNEPAQESSDLDTIHLGIFFDGTSNNMVQQACYFSSKFNISVGGIGRKNISPESAKMLEAKEKLETEIYNIDNAIFQRMSYNPYITEDIENLYRQRNKKTAELEELITTFEISDQELKNDHQNGYSNIAILYSIFDTKKLEEQGKSKARKFYIEGSGATDITHLSTKNVNGLGFGLGMTGVTALVSKAVRVVTNYINSLDDGIAEKTKLKFYIFGFSRGSTCARLFTHLLTRDCKSKLHREKEFEEFLPKTYFHNGRLCFLEEQKGVHTTKLQRSNITIEYLGIYDTVASIGFLRQKDGWYDPLRSSYSNFENYKTNWHYKNVTEYGLYLCQDEKKLKNVCHIGALDEFRENFAFTNIGDNISKNAVEIMMPGCHSDVGGGYIDGTEQEISLTLYTRKQEEPEPQNKHSKGDLRTFIPLKDNINKVKYNPIITTDEKPQIDYFDAYNIGIDSLEAVGWLDKDRNKKKGAARRTLRVVEHNHKLYFKVLYFKRFVLRGWSDVSLAMIIANASANGFDLFRDTVYDYKKTLKRTPDVIPDTVVKEVIEMGTNAVGQAGSAKKGTRIWLVPGGSNNSSKYKNLRLNYVHFTSTSSLVHVSLKRGLEGELSNFGNKPNFDLEGLLCRITYDGDNVEYNQETDYRKAVRYIYELSKNKIISL